jgi:hypothetical protein
MTQTIDAPRHSPTAAIVLTVIVGVIATVVAYLGTRQNPQAPVLPPASAAGTGVVVESIALPHDEPDLPLGPHQRTFVASCTICHSTRLVMTQPPFLRKQWTEVVHKMVKTYGAPLNPETEEEVVDYLTAVRGKFQNRE